MKVFTNSNGQLRSLWWAAIFFIILAVATFPLILLSQHYKWEITMGHQAILVVAVTWICQLLRRKAFTEVSGSFNIITVQQFFRGLLIGAVLMILPAISLYLGGWVRWEFQAPEATTILSATLVFIAVAVAEEFLFRGFLFQRLLESIGIWGTQLILAGYFLLTHINNPGMAGNIKVFASINIFLASIMFGLAFIKTRSLSMPIGIHFAANWVQGTFFGFGVSGNEDPGILHPVFNSAPAWLTGGQFGLEASVPGLISVIVILIALYFWKPINTGPSPVIPAYIS